MFTSSRWALPSVMYWSLLVMVMADPLSVLLMTMSMFLRDDIACHSCLDMLWIRGKCMLPALSILL